ncbi:MAG: hypothetical protein ABJN35_08800 [Erythrobacter sp.]
MTPINLEAAVLIGLGVLLLILAIWMFVRASRTTTIVGDDQAGKDVLDEGATPAARNQALIDAPSAAIPAHDLTPKVETPPEPVAAPQPAAQAETKPAPKAASGEGDDLRMIKGVGPKLVTLLAEQGVTSFAQIAAWTDADIERVDATLGRFAGRITRDQWVAQAKLLTSGEETAFSSKFGKNG